MSEQTRAAVAPLRSEPPMTDAEERELLEATERTFAESADFYSRFGSLVRE